MNTYRLWARVRQASVGLDRRDDGAGLVEYALLVAFIAIALIGALVLLRGGLEGFFSDAGDTLSSST